MARTPAHEGWIDHRFPSVRNPDLDSALSRLQPGRRRADRRRAGPLSDPVRLLDDDAVLQQTNPLFDQKADIQPYCHRHGGVHHVPVGVCDLFWGCVVSGDIIKAL